MNYLSVFDHFVGLVVKELTRVLNSDSISTRFSLSIKACVRYFLRNFYLHQMIALQKL